MNNEFATVEKVTLSEAKEVFSEPHIRSRVVATSPEKLELSDIENIYVLKYMGYRILFSLMPMDLAPDIYEVHLSIPEDSVKARRALCYLILYWVFTVHAPEAKAVYTNANYKTLSNMAKKLGFSFIGSYNGYDHFIYPNNLSSQINTVREAI